MSNKKVVGIIPARYQSTRFPGKPLVKIAEKPLIVRVAEILSMAIGIDSTYVATDDLRIKSIVENYGFNCVMTTTEALTGTDRVWQAAQEIKSDIYINVQGDEPLIRPNDILKIIGTKQLFPNHVINGWHALSESEDPNDVNIPKVLINHAGDLIYMSRLPIPGSKKSRVFKPSKFKKQVCIYAFTYKELELYGSHNRKTAYEQEEDIEILRFFDLNIPIKMVETSNVSLAVDNPPDVDKVEQFIKQQKPSFKNILFDFDGVILDSMATRELGFRTIFSSYPKVLVDKLLKYHNDNGGLSRYVKIRYFYEQVLGKQIKENDLQILAQEYSNIMRSELIDPANLISETVDLIKSTYEKYDLHIVSGSDHEELNFLCQKLNIAHFFQTISGSPTAKTTLVANLLNEYQYHPDDCILIGDSINDYHSAESNGLRFMGYNNKKLVQLGNKYLFSIGDLFYP